jgi:hypothetical protein
MELIQVDNGRHLKVSEVSRITGISKDRIRYLFRNGSIYGIRLNSGTLMIKVTNNGDLVYKGEGSG